MVPTHLLGSRAVLSLKPSTVAKPGAHSHPLHPEGGELNHVYGGQGGWQRKGKVGVRPVASGGTHDAVPKDLLAIIERFRGC